jgi:hypothetical protein
MSSVNIEKLVEIYLTIRTEREALLSKYETEDQKLKLDMKQIEIEMLSICNEVNANSINTTHGTVMRKLSERFYCNDWDGFKQFVRDEDALDLFERRIHQGNFKQFMASKDADDGLPPGVNVMREYGITVRKSSSNINS